MTYIVYLKKVDKEKQINHKVEINKKSLSSKPNWPSERKVSIQLQLQEGNTQLKLNKSETES